MASVAMVAALVPAAHAQQVAASDGAGVAHPELWPAREQRIAPDPAMEKRIDQLLAAMSLEQKVGQIVQGDIASTTPEDVRRYHLGSVLNGGNSDPGGRYNAPAKDWLALADAFYEASMAPNGNLPRIPIMWGSDAVHGHNNVVGATLFPHNIGLGAARDPELLRSIGAVTAKEMRVTGLDWTFAPTLAIVRDDRWGRTYEGFGEAPEIAASYAAPLIEGLQGKIGDKDWLRGPHIIATAKHSGRRRHLWRQGPGRYADFRSWPDQDLQCALHSRARCRGSVGDGQLFQLEWHQDARQPVAADRRDEAALGL
jgi:beta-glucosidase